MTDYVLAHHGDDAERQRLALLHEFHGGLTLTQLEAAAVRPDWHCLEVGAGTGALTSWLAERLGPTGHVLAMDLETHWLEPLQSEIVEIRPSASGRRTPRQALSAPAFSTVPRSTTPQPTM